MTKSEIKAILAFCEANPNHPAVKLYKLQIEQAQRKLAEPQEELDVFGRPVSKVSPRVQRIRDLQAGRRVAPAKPARIWDWGKPKAQPTIAPVQSQPAPRAKTYEEQMADLKAKMDQAADYMEQS